MHYRVQWAAFRSPMKNHRLEGAIQQAAEAAAMLLVRQLGEIHDLEWAMEVAIREIVAADRVIIAIEASETSHGLRLMIVPAQNVETLQ